MSTRDTSSIQLLERAYSYLRLSGASEASCCRQVQWLAGALADAMEKNGSSNGEVLNALWQRLLEEGERLDRESAEAVVLAPPPERGSIGYARFGKVPR